jgi:hypothetical protein
MKAEFEAEIRPDDKNKRQCLVNLIDMAISAGSLRITPGVYRITIERVPNKPEDQQE